MKSKNQNVSVQKFICALAFFLFLVKWSAWHITHSIAVFTDALESITNLISSFIGLYSLQLALLPKDRNHPYGHGKIEFISAALEGFFIVIAGAVMLTEAFFRWGTPYKEIRHIDLGIFILLGTALINYLAGTLAYRVSCKNDSIALLASGRHLQIDALSTLGVVAGLVLVYFTGWMWIDILSAVIFAFLILYTGMRLLRRAFAGVMDESDEQLIGSIVDYLEIHRKPNWIDLHNLRIIKYGSALHIDAHLTLPWFFNVRKAHNEVDDLRSLIRKKFIHKVEFFIHVDACFHNSCQICSKRDCLVRTSSFERQLPWTFQNVSHDAPHSLKKYREELN